MPDEFTKRFFEWADAEKLRPSDLADMLKKKPQTIYNWRNAGIPKGQRVTCQYFMDKSREEKFEQIRSSLVLNPTPKQLDAWNEAALAKGMTIKDWVFEGLEEMAEDFFKSTAPENITSIQSAVTDSEKRVAEPKTEYKANEGEGLYEIPFLGSVAAGEPVTAPLDDTISVPKEYPDGHFAVRVNGQSMEPTLEDGALIICEPKEYTPANGKVYVLTDGSGCSVKRFDRKKRAFVSDNPDFPDLTPVGEVKIQGLCVEVLNL